MRPVGTEAISPHQSGASPFISTHSVVLTRSGSPIDHLAASSRGSGGGMSAGSPCGAPPFTQASILASSRSVREGSYWYCWMPMFFSMYQGGMTPATGPMWVRLRMPLA